MHKACLVVTFHFCTGGHSQQAHVFLDRPVGSGYVVGPESWDQEVLAGMMAANLAELFSNPEVRRGFSRLDWKQPVRRYGMSNGGYLRRKLRGGSPNGRFSNGQQIRGDVRKESGRESAFRTVGKQCERLVNCSRGSEAP